MKQLLLLLCFICLTSCNSKLQKNSITENLATKDTVATATTPLSEYQTDTDTLTKTSKSFSLNGLKCYWRQDLTVYDCGNDSYGLDILMKLIASESAELLLQYEFSPRYADYYDYKSENYFHHPKNAF